MALRKITKDRLTELIRFMESLPEEFFKLTAVQEDFLFGDRRDRVKTPKQWAKLAREFLKADGVMKFLRG